MSQTEIPPRRPPKGRSPSYPGIDLEQAVRRVRQIYVLEKQHPAPVSTILDHWGYAPNSGGGRVTLAALKKFGLMEDEGNRDSRVARLTDLAAEIVLNPDPGPAIRRAALSPGIHRELWEEYGADLPSEATLRYKLIRERLFTESGADEFIGEYRQTLLFAGLEEEDDQPRDNAFEVGAPDIPLPREAASPDQRSPALQPVPLSSIGSMPAGLTIPIPLPGDQIVQLTGAFPLTEEAWEQLLRVLEVMKPGLVTTQPPSSPPTATEP